MNINELKMNTIIVYAKYNDCELEKVQFKIEKDKINISYVGKDIKNYFLNGLNVKKEAHDEIYEKIMFLLQSQIPENLECDKLSLNINVISGYNNCSVLFYFDNQKRVLITEEWYNCFVKLTNKKIFGRLYYPVLLSSDEDH